MSDRPIGDAGLVVLAPFLPHLFAGMQSFAGEPPRMSAASLGRAVAMLQWLAGSEQLGDPALPLILCGAAPDADVPAAELDDADRALGGALLDAVLAHWTALSNTSHAGLQEAFLQREGRLSPRAEGGWQLEVERKVVDVLVDQIPWSFTTVLHRWMSQPVQVVW